MRFSSTVLWAVSLVGGAGVASATTINVALLSTLGSTFESDVISKIQTDAPFINIHVIEVTAIGSTPLLSDLETNYQTVMVAGSNAFGDAGLLGNELKQYIDDGHGLVITAQTNNSGSPQCTGTTSNQLCGTFNNSDYWAIEPGALNSGNPATLGTIQVPGSSLLNGVTGFNGGTASIRISGVLNSNLNTTEVAAWSGGTTPLLAIRTFSSGATEVALNFFPVSGASTGGAGWTTGGDQIMVNALKLAANYSDSSDPVPEAQSLLLAGVGLAGISLLLKRRLSGQTKALDAAGPR